MKPILLNKKNISFQQSFIVSHHQFPQFLKLWHYHPELELLCVLESTGTCFAGDKITSFEAGTLMLLGTNLPHMLKNDAIYFQEDSTLSAEAIVVHFPLTFIKESSAFMLELKTLDSFLKKADRGILFKNKKIKPLVKHRMQQLLTLDNFSRMIQLLDLLKLLADEKEYELLASEGYANSLHYSEGRLDKIYAYAMNNFDDPFITLDDVAATVNMNQAAFCRYFKKVTNKTFFQYLNEIRVGYACKLLLEEDKKNISEIAYLSGFNNISNFNRHFKTIMGMVPSAYVRLRHS